MADMRKCGIIGTGNVGAASAYTLAVSGLFSEVLLLDADMHRAEGEAADIAHGAALRRPCRVHAGGYADFADCGLVILAAGTNQRPGETREALLGRNRAILQSILEQLTAVNRDAVLLVVSNPVDVLTGYTLDDFCLAAGIDDPESMLASLAREVTHAAYDIIERKGATCYGIAMAVRRIAEAIIRDEHAVLPVSTLARGAYGIEGVCLGLPAVVGRSGVSRVLDLPLSRDETERLLASAHKLKTLMEG